MKLTGAQVVVEEMVKHGVSTVFGYPGGYVIDIYDELYKNSHRINHILTAHEQGAAHAADAFTRVTGKTAAVIATSGPGATNLVTGIANAYLDSVPVVFITGNVPVPMLGQDSFQEIDVIGVTLPIVKHSYVVRDVTELQTTLREAFAIAGSGRKGPVLVDIPKCVQIAVVEYDGGLQVISRAGASRPTDWNRFGDAVSVIGKCERPYIYCGGGVTATESGPAVMALSKKIGAPVGLSMMGIGAVPYSYELNLGMSGMHGRYASNAAMSEADLIIALGVRFSDRATGGIQDFVKNSTILHIDVDAAELGKNVRADIGICGDVGEILPELIDLSHRDINSMWVERALTLKAEDETPCSVEFEPRSIINLVNIFYGDEIVVATDVGQHQIWVAQYYKFEKPRKLIASGGLGAMGYGLGAAIGASIAMGRVRTVLFTGDGSFGMNLIELATAVSQKLPLTIIILNNGALGMVRQMQALFYNGRYSQTELDRGTDFPALARAFGAAGHSAASLEELESVLESAPCDGPCVIDCKICIDER